MKEVTIKKGRQGGWIWLRGQRYLDRPLSLNLEHFLWKAMWRNTLYKWAQKFVPRADEAEQAGAEESFGPWRRASPRLGLNITTDLPNWGDAPLSLRPKLSAPALSASSTRGTNFYAHLFPHERDGMPPNWRPTEQASGLSWSVSLTAPS